MSFSTLIGFLGYFRVAKAPVSGYSKKSSHVARVDIEISSLQRHAVQKLIAFAVTACAIGLTTIPSLASAQNPVDLTGSYGLIAPCTDEVIANNPGEIYVRHCFLGEKHALVASLWLVQNGNSVCGNYTECGGFNCGKVYSGRMAGRVTGNTVTLFSETGHDENGLADIRTFTIVPGGLSSDPNAVKPTYVRRAQKLEDASVAQMCKPNLPNEVQLKNYALDIPGLLATENVKFSENGQEKRIQPPMTKRFSLSKLKAAYEWEDRREAGNYVPRTVIIRNDSKVAWTVGTQHPEVCREFLSSADRPKSKLLLGEEAQFGGVEIKSGKSAGFLSCKGSIWTFEDKTACPRFTCSENCIC